MALPSLRTAQSVQPTGCSNSFRPVLQNSDEKLKILETFRACYRAGIRANRYIRANRDGTIQFLIDWMKLNRETAAPAYDGVVKVYDDDINTCEKGLRLVIDETKKTVKSSREMSFSDITDLSILRTRVKIAGRRRGRR